MKELLDEAGVPTARFGAFDRRSTRRVGFLRTLPGPWVVKTDGLAAGKGVLVADRPRRGRGRRGGQAERGGLRRGRPAGGGRGGPGRDRVLAAGRCATAAGWCPWPRPRTSSGSATATPGPTPAGWAPTRRCPGVGDDLVGRAGATRGGAAAWRALRARGDRLPGRALRRPDAHRRTARGCSSSTCASATPRPRSSCPAWPGTRWRCWRAVADGRLASVRDGAGFAGDAAVCVVLAAAGYPASPATGDPIAGLAADGQLAEPVDGVTVFHAGTRRGRRRPARSSPPAAGCSGSPPLAPTLAEARRRRLRRRRAGSRGTGAQFRAATSPSAAPAGAACASRAEPGVGRPGDPPLLPRRHGGALQRRGPHGPVARGRAAGGRGPGRGRGGARPPTPRPCRARAPVVDAAFVAAVAERERVTDHDVAAFVDVVQRRGSASPRASWVHYGLTSSDVVDTALCATLAAAGRPARGGGRRAGGRRCGPGRWS